MSDILDDDMEAEGASTEPKKPKLSPSAMEKILKAGRDFFSRSVEADAWNRAQGLDDLKFVENIDNYQWPLDAQRVRKGRPMMVENRLPQFSRQVVNNIRRNRPAISVIPASEDATDEVAEVLEGMTRHVEQRSRADLAYDGGAESAVKCSIGYWRVVTEYADEMSFDQELAIKPIPNPFTVYDDPDCIMPDKSDRRACIVSERKPRTEFKAEYGFDPAPFEAGTTGDDIEWYGQDDVRIAEYWRVVYDKKEIYRLPDGTVVEKAQLKGIDPETLKSLPCREVQVPRVEMHLMTGDKIIETTEWIGRYIPIIAVIGEEVDIEGRKFRKSLVRDAKDSQRTNNYMLSAEVEMVSLTPKVPWVGPKGSFKTDSQKWATMNTENWPYVEYDGQTAPQRNYPTGFPDGIRQSRMSAIEGMKAVMGLYDASLGARSNETSGVAIENREKQGDNATFHFVDNMIRAIRYGGLVVVDLLPKVYDAARVARTLKADGTAKLQAINQIFIGPDGQPAQIDISRGKYDVVVTAGSYQTQRQENRNSMIELGKILPQMTQVAPDLMVKNFDFPEADELARRLKATVPPQILGADNPQIPPEVQQAMQAVQQQQQQVSQIGQQVEAERAQLDAEKAQVEAAKKELAADQKVLQARYNELSAKLDLQALQNVQPVPAAMPPGPPQEPAINPMQ